MKTGKLNLQGIVESAEAKLNLDFGTQVLMRNLIQESFDRKAHDLSSDENLGNVFIDVYSDATGIDAANSENYEHRGAANYDVIKVDPTELDYMEYASDGAAQTAYVTDAAGLELDYMEYASDGVAQAAYVSSDASTSEVVDQQNTSFNDSEALGGVATDKEYRQAQSFILSGAKTVTAVEVRLTSISGSPTGNWTLRIESDDSGEPSASLAHANASVVVSPPSAGNSIKGTFSTPFQLNGSTTYWLVVQCDNQADSDRWRLTTNQPSTYADGMESLSPTGGGNGTWTSNSNIDLWFKVYVNTTPNLQSYSEASIKNQGSYSLKGVALITDSLNDTLTRTINLIDSYSETNQDTYAALGAGVTNNEGGQALTLGSSYSITSVKFYLSKLGSPTGSVYARIYAATGTVGSTAVPTGAVLATSDAIDVSSLSSDPSYSLIEFIFSTPYNASAGDYCIMCYYNGGDGSNRVHITGDGTSPTHSGNFCRNVSGATAGTDTCFYLYTSSLDLTDKDTLKIDVRASRTGTNLQIQIHDSGGQTSTKDIIISSADTWETTTWDISGIANADKDAIDSIVFKILNADSATTYYIDNFRVPEALQCYSEGTIKNQGTYSLKAVADQTASLNKTLTKSSLSIDLTDIDTLKFWAYASRTGTNLQLQIHDSGGTTSTKDVVISSADTWTEITWDISGIANADKDDIDSIIVKVTNADSANTFYVDNFSAPADSAIVICNIQTLPAATDEILAMWEENLNGGTITVYVSADNGANYTEVTSPSSYSSPIGTAKYKRITGLTAGTQGRLKLVLTGSAELESIAMAW